MLHFIFDFILKSQPSRPSPLMPFTKTTGPEGIYSLKARPWLLTPSLFIYTQPRTSQCIPEMALVTLAIGNLRLITLPQVKKYQSRFLRCFYFFSRMTPAGFYHSRGDICIRISFHTHGEQWRCFQWGLPVPKLQSDHCTHMQLISITLYNNMALSNML